MSTLKYKGKRSIDDTDDWLIKKNSASSGTPKPHGHASINYSSKPKQLKLRENATKMDIKLQVPYISSNKLCENPVVKGGELVSSSSVTKKWQSSNSKNYSIKPKQLKLRENATMMDIKLQVPDISSKKLCENPVVKRRELVSSSSVTRKWQSSNSKNNVPTPTFVCEICIEHKTAIKLFNIQGCSHAYCTKCIIKYVASKLQENITCIRCPLADCKGLLEPEYCRKILPKDVFDRWVKALCEDVIPRAQKFYCPFKNCSALMIDDGEVIRESECPHCNRLFCAQCKVPWHAGISCAEFQKLNKNERDQEDIMLMNLAQNKNWKRCPNCRYYVEKKDGCMHMKCRCGYAFCYNCGACSVTNSHLCPKCMH